MNFVFPGTASELISGTQNVTDARFPPLWRVIWSISIWKGVLLLVVLIAPFIIPATGAFFTDVIVRVRLPESIWIWGNFDGVHYVSIARSGYFASTVPFFPFYPFLIKMFVEVTHISFVVAGQIISIASLWLATIVGFYVLKLERQERLFPTFLAVLFTYPTAFYYAGVYNDALYFFLATLTILFARRKSWFYAAVTSALATLTRLNGLALPFLIACEYLLSENDNKSWNFAGVSKKLWLSIKALRINHAVLVGIVASPLAFLAYVFWVHRSFGTWQLLFSSMQVWQQDRLTLPFQVIGRYIKIFLLSPTNELPFWIAVVEFVSVTVYVLLFFLSFKKIRFSYWLFFFVSILIPSMTGTFQGMPRYGLHIYPFFLLLTLILSQRGKVVRTIYFLVSAAVQVTFLSLFSRGYFVS